MDTLVGGVTVAFLIIGITQFIKKLIEGDPDAPEPKKLTYRASQILSLVVSIIVLTTATLVNGEYLSPEANQIIKEVITVIAGILAVPGLYSVGSDKILPALRR